ncbi:MAG: amidohydrolase family protein, partial [Acidobacteriota bacterium]
EGYPTSLMGAIAVVRQTLLDTQRYATWEHRYHADPIGMRRPEEISAFAALEGAMAGADRLIFDIEDSADVARALRIAEEFSINAIVIGSGAENQEPGSIDALKKAGYPVILPLAYPEKPKVEDPDEALNVSLHDLRRWHAAPANPEALHEAGIPFALGTCRLDGVGEFIGNLRKAIDRGLPVDVALASLTVQPARMFGLDRVLGTIAPGKIANLAVFEGDTPQHGVFAEKARTTRVFVDGVKFEIERKKSKRNPDAKEDPAGTWSITFSIAGRTISRTWTISGEPGHYEGTAETREGTVDFESIVVLGNEMTVKLPGRMGSRSQAIVVILKGDSLEGEGEFPGGMSFTIKGKRIAGPQGGDQ